MAGDDLQQRTKSFALRIIRLVRAMPKTLEGRAVAGQLIRSGMSVGANYRAALRGRSRAEFRAKIGVVVEEADETCYWLELIVASEIMSERRVAALLKEAQELTAIFTQCAITSRRS